MLALWTASVLPVSFATIGLPQGLFIGLVVVDIEALSVSDLDELERWLRGELRPAVRGKRAPIPAIQRGLGTLLSRVLGGERRQYEAKSSTFTA